MPTLERRALGALVLLACVAAAIGAAATPARAGVEPTPRAYAPLVLGPDSAPAPPSSIPSDWLGRVNYYRALAGVPPVTEDAGLSANCVQHARYMAENNHLTHQQDPGKPYASAAGQVCAGKGNAWLGQGTSWEPANSVDGWVSSVGHRLWLIYPTTPQFGYGFATAAQREGAAMDVLSRANFAADAAYTGWPVRYPGANQAGVPANAAPITLMWRYFGATPQISATSLATEGGAPIAHSADTALPAGHKGVQITPAAALPDNTVFVVSVSGTYGGVPFSTSWRFSTGDTSLTAEAKGAEEPEVGEAVAAE